MVNIQIRGPLAHITANRFTENEIASNPAARPSRPSVRLTALDVEVTTKIIIRGYSNPKSTTVSFKKGIDVTVLKLSHAGVL